MAIDADTDTDTGDSDTRFVLYGGKGGVGKTTCAAATGYAAADRGERVLVVSTDPAHSLGDVLGVELDDEPSPAPDADGIDAVEVSPEAGQAAYRAVVESFAASFREAGVRIDEAEVDALFEAGLVPGGDELAALEYVADYADAGYDLVVLDTAPTGHTLRLLDLPEVLGEALGTAGEVQKRVGRLVDSARSFVVGPAAFLRGGDDGAFDRLRGRLDEVAAVLRDPERTSFRPVLVPEAMAIAETDRLVGRLRESSVPVGRVVVNRVLEDPDPDCERCGARHDLHVRRIAETRERFPDLSVVTLPELVGEAGGADSLRELASRLEGEG
jgi:arsenite-transporting ATPase